MQFYLLFIKTLFIFKNVNTLNEFDLFIRKTVGLFKHRSNFDDSIYDSGDMLQMLSYSIMLYNIM